MGRYLSASILILTLTLTANLQAQQQPQGEPSYDQSQVLLEQDILPGAPKIVLIAGSKSHGPMEHEFFAGTAILQKMLKQNGINAVMARDGWPKNEKIFDGAAARGERASREQVEGGSPAPGLPDCADFAQSGMAVIPLLDCWGGKDPENASIENVDSGFLTKSTERALLASST